MYPIVEIFGPTIQGEGIQMGRRTMFVRLAGCDFRCRWCDTDYAFDTANADQLSPRDIVAQIQQMAPHCKTVTLTGGNPCIHDLQPLLDYLRAAGYEIQVETQGSIWQDGLKMVDMINLSPKPPSSGMHRQKLTLEEFITQANNLQLKMVVLTPEDYEYARQLHRQYPEVPMVLQVCNEPGNDNTENLMVKYRALVSRAAADTGINDNVRVLPQIHVLAWGNRRGV